MRAIVVAVCGLLVSVGSVRAVVLQPGEADSQDVFIYQFLPTFNFETIGPGFQQILSVVKTSTGHDTRSLLAFDLAAVPWSAGEVTHAALGLYVRDGTTVGFPFANPSPLAPVLVQVEAVGGPWQESTVTWLTQPATAAGPVATSLVSGIGGYIEFDVTAVVQQWLSGSLAHYGFLVTQINEILQGGKRVAVVFDSSAGACPPFLRIVPEPAVILLWAAGAVLVRRRNDR